jgi:hypothetical protein
MKVAENIPLLDEILGQYRDEIARDYDGYRNHVYRMVNFCFARNDFSDEAKEKIVIAGAFHDIGIWSGNTFDYLPPSISAATEYLNTTHRPGWVTEINLMIDQHHRLRKYPGSAYPLVEVFRQGDLVDFSLGLIKCGLPGPYVHEVKKVFPNAGFHKQLAGRACRWFIRHPLNPIPVLKW